ncbi:hypothetical protein PINS_up003600 [Pythium insidiosum]|nr:hypothetical protein PINS_up003600 [Pythium insidiosum]
MDTVTEAEMAIAMALQGGIGILHCLTSIEAQSDMVRAVKQFENGFIVAPRVLSPTHTIADLDQLKVSGVPITEDGKPNGKLVGLVTSRDVDFIEDRSLPLSRVMVPARAGRCWPVPVHTGAGQQDDQGGQEGHAADRQQRGPPGVAGDAHGSRQEPRLPERAA